LGTYPGTAGPTQWYFDWTVPAVPPTEVIFYAAGNAANNNGTNSGDYIYTTSFTAQLSTTAVEEPGPAGPRMSLSSTPNPTRERALITYWLPVPGPVTLQVFDAGGGLVAEWTHLDPGAGLHREWWSGRDRSLRPVPSGAYLFRLACSGAAVTERLIVLR
jgi:hypothetical protein